MSAEARPIALALSSLLISGSVDAVSFSLTDADGRIRPFGNYYDQDYCLTTVDRANDKHVELEICTNAAEALWSHDSGTGLVQQQGTDQCWSIPNLKVPSKSMPVALTTCDAGDQLQQFSISNEGRLTPTHKVPGDQVCLRANARDQRKLKYGGCHETSWGNMDASTGVITLVDPSTSYIQMFGDRYDDRFCLAPKDLKSGKTIQLETCRDQDRFKWAYDEQTQQVKTLTGDLCMEVDSLFANMPPERGARVRVNPCDAASQLQAFTVTPSGRLYPTFESSVDQVCLRAKARSYSDKSNLAYAGCHETTWGDMTVTVTTTTESPPLPCDAQPCQNGGSCTNAYDSVTDSYSAECTCPVQYTGTNCESEIPCEFTPCENGGTCTNTLISSSGSTYECACTADFGGTNCELQKPCSTSPCNGGTCTDAADLLGYSCICPDTRTGLSCETVFPCSDHDCLNGGTCTNNAFLTDYVCNCPDDFAGDRCEITKPCSSTPCQNSGTCTDTDNFSSFVCSCDGDHTGTTCEIVLPCSTNPCVNGVCSNSADFSDFACFCNTGFTGSVCDQTVACRADSCANGGTCVDSADGLTFTCTCLDGFTGADCSTAVPCASNPCVTGTCKDTDDLSTYECLCDVPMIGENCAVESSCASTPCENGGDCIEDSAVTVTDATGTISTVYTCSCPEEFFGDNCETEKPCISQPCTNGLCIDLQDFSGFTCACDASHTGGLCEILYSCTATPCENSGVCTDSEIVDASGLLTEYTCDCAAGFTGENCDAALPCTSNPCINGGTCQDTNATAYTCACETDFTGDNCEIRKPCADDPCALGSCTDSVDFTTFTCDCSGTGRTGELCDVIATCSTNDPCINGVCSETDQVSTQSITFNGNDFLQSSTVVECTCDTGFTGDTCETALPCTNNPCLQGTCEESADFTTYNCTCDADYFGTNCDIFSGCASQPCLNNGTCTDDLENLVTEDVTSPEGITFTSQVTGAVCTCAEGFTGDLCADELHCTSAPCLNGGNCTDTTGAFDCTCPPQFTGTTCENEIPCAELPCAFGQCSNSADFSSFTCTCDTGYIGDICDVLSSCASDPCLNGGTCTDDPDNFVVQNSTVPSGASALIKNSVHTCSCAADFFGDNCETAKPCSLTPCQNNGVCTDSADFASYTCACDADHVGDNCETRKPCSLSPCLNNATACADNADFTDYSCTCDTAFTGKSCEQCVDEFSGDNCEIPVPCAANPCFTGTCSNNPGFTTLTDFTCTCDDPNFYGNQCEIELPCVAGPCQNDGVCSDVPTANIIDGVTILDFSCACTWNFTGTTCIQAASCGVDPQFGVDACGPHGSCTSTGTDSMDQYTCDCTSEWSGADCNVQSECLAAVAVGFDLCSNGGTCADDFSANRTGSEDAGGDQRWEHLIAGFSCACTWNFTGSICTEAASCGVNPQFGVDACGPHGSCTSTGTDSMDQYTCDCGADWTGADCNVQSECLAAAAVGFALCSNGGTCLDDFSVNRTGSEDAGGDERWEHLIAGYNCDCVADVATGPNCDIVLGCNFYSLANETTACRNGGTCTNLQTTTTQSANIKATSRFTATVTDFDCACTADFTGPTCEIPVPCASDPCINGQCTDLADFSGYTCNCTDQYMGDNCDVLRRCQSDDPCANGNCTDLTTFTTDGTGVSTSDYTCTCSEGFTGVNCDIPIPCFAEPCEQGTCSNADDFLSYNCECDAAFVVQYIGTNCDVVSACHVGPCQNAGVCSENGTIFSFDSSIGGNLADYTCDCPAEYVGTNCETRIPCVDNPCVNGVCTNLVDFSGYTCDCDANFHGDDCDVPTAR